MNIKDYKETIIKTLRGNTEELIDISDRLDWDGISAVLKIYRETSGTNRENIIQAIGNIIEEGKADPEILAQVLWIAHTNDLTQLEPQVRKLQKKSVASNEYIDREIDSYLALIPTKQSA
jgi:hypothetical protein